MPKLAVLGQPVGHSRSPAMLNAALAELGLAPEWSYGSIEVTSRDLAPLVRSLPEQGFAGVNVTIPHKVAALALADEQSVVARGVGAANTLSFRDGRVIADNTDAPGILAALPHPPSGNRALVLGAGGSARAAVWALREAGAQVWVWNRTAERAARLADELGVAHAGTPPRDLDLIVNATSVGLRGPEATPHDAAAEAADLKALPIDADALHAVVVLDLVYANSETQLVAAARAAGASVVDGLEVLVRQGGESLRIWTGLEPPIEVMRAAVRSV